MDLAWVQTATSLALGIGLAACAGLRAWLPLLLAGLLARVELLTLGPSFRFIASTEALILFGSATVAEILGDKIPAVDHALDAISTVLRPAAASLLAASVLWTVEDPLIALVLGVSVGAPVSLVPHVAKSALRAASTAVTAGIANPFLSLAEDVIAIVVFVLAVLVPLLLALVVLVTGVWILSRLRRRRATAPSAVPAR